MTASIDTRPDTDDDSLEALARAFGVYRDPTAGAWRDDAACRNAELRPLFYPGDLPSHERDNAIRTAKWLCRRCPVREACLEWALSLRPVDDHGIAAGTSSRERARIRAARRDAA